MNDHRRSRFRVGLNAHLLSLAHNYRGAGINGYIFQLLHCLPALSGDQGVFEYHAFLHDRAFTPAPGLSLNRSGWNTGGPWRRIVWEQTRLAVLSRELDLIHGLAYAAPLAAGCPAVVTVHDLSFMRFPSAFRWLNRTYLGFITRASTRRAVRVIAVSESTRQDVIALCGVPGHRVINVPNGVSPAFSPASEAEVRDFRRQKGLPNRFILFLGTLEPRKNIERLLEAYEQLRRVDKSAPCLVIAGGKGWFYESIYRRVQELGLAGEVSFPGFVAGDELAWWYRAAEVFVYPSRFEGFGLPVLEAMASGTPVITSNVSSLPEVAGDAAILVDPEDVTGLAAALARILSDGALAQELRWRGLRQAARFSWQRTARETAQVYAEALGLNQQEAAR